MRAERAQFLAYPLDVASRMCERVRREQLQCCVGLRVRDERPRQWQRADAMGKSTDK